MAHLDSANVAAVLRKKLKAESVQKDHTFLYIYNDTGIRIAQTKISHGPAHTLGNSLLNQIARQLRPDSPQSLVHLVDCTLERDEALAVMERNRSGPQCSH